VNEVDEDIWQGLGTQFSEDPVLVESVYVVKLLGFEESYWDREDLQEMFHISSSYIFGIDSHLECTPFSAKTNTRIGISCQYQNKRIKDN
jgi:hypothetical protein